jgi:hypothetical protein
LMRVLWCQLKKHHHQRIFCEWVRSCITFHRIWDSFYFFLIFQSVAPTTWDAKEEQAATAVQSFTSWNAPQRGTLSARPSRAGSVKERREISRQEKPSVNLLSWNIRTARAMSKMWC